MAALTGSSPKNTYKDLMHLNNSNSGVDASLRTVLDGEGVSTALDLGTGGAKINGTFEVTGVATFGGGLDLSGLGSLDGIVIGGVTPAAGTFTTLTASSANFTSLTVASAVFTLPLPVASGGTGATDASAARTGLGLGTMATQAANSVAITGGSITGITDLAVADGGTGASDASAARTNLGLGTMATQSASAVALLGGTSANVTHSSSDFNDGRINNTTIGASAAHTIVGTTIQAKEGAPVNQIGVASNAYTLVLSDAGKTVEMTSSASMSVTIPASGSVAYAVGTYINVAHVGPGSLSFAAAGGVTINSAGALTDSANQYSLFSLYKQATNVWILAGNLA